MRLIGALQRLHDLGVVLAQPLDPKLLAGWMWLGSMLILCNQTPSHAQQLPRKTHALCHLVYDLEDVPAVNPWTCGNCFMEEDKTNESNNCALLLLSD